MSRKILSLIVAVAFVLTMVSTAFAATLPSDVTGDTVKAVSEMQSLNIMIGDAGTGLFRPNDTIKRSEFAVLAVKAMGLNDTALISAGTTKFSDVAADNWAAGYINAAVGAGIISGYPDGTYKPDNTINYSEAVNILVRMLGYGPVLAGKPMAAYVAQANVSGITSGVVMAPTVGASRGNVAKLVSNTLSANELQVSGYDVNGKPTYATSVDNKTKSLMSDKLSVDQVKEDKGSNGLTADCTEYTVTNTPSVQGGATSDVSTFTATSGTVKAVHTYNFVDSLNANDYLGLNVNAWTNSAGKVVVAQITNNVSDIYDGIVSKDGDNIKLEGKSSSYGSVAASDFVGYLNGTPAAFTVIRNALDKDKGMGRVVLSNGLIKFASVWASTASKLTGSIADDSTSYAANQYVVADVTGGYINSINSAQQAIKVQDIKDWATNQTRQITITKNGAAATIDDVKANDVVLEVKNKSHYTFIISEKAVTGTLSAISGSDITGTLTIGGTGYTVATNNLFSTNGTTTDGKPLDFTVSGDANKNFTDSVTGAIGNSVTVFLNAVGQIADYTSSAKSTTYYYGIVKSFSANVGSALDNAVTLTKADGTKVSYTFDDDTNVRVSTTTTTSYAKLDTYANLKDVTLGDLVQYQLTSSGKIKDESLLLANDSKAATNDGHYGTANFTDNNVITVGGSSPVITSATAIFNISTTPNGLAHANDDASVIAYSTIKGKTAGSLGTYQVFYGTDNIVKAIVVNAAAGIAANTTGVVVNTGIDGDGKTLIVNENGTQKTYKVTSPIGDAANITQFGYLAAGRYVEYKVDGNGKVTDIDYSTANGNLKNVSYISAFDIVGTGAAGTATLGIYGSVATGSNIVKVISVDTTNKLIKYEFIKTNGTYSGDSSTDYYLRYDPANLNVYDATDKGNNNIKGGLDISAVKAGAYVWLGGKNDGPTGAYDFSRIVILKLDDIKVNGSH